MRQLRLALLGLVAFVAIAAPAAAENPTTSVQVLGQRAEGVLRFPQAVGIGPDGNVYVGDQFSHQVQVFTPDGRFVRELGLPGRTLLGAVGGVAVGADGQAYVAHSANRIERFGAGGGYLGGWGRKGSGLGQFNFGAGHANDAGAGGGVAVRDGLVYVADTLNNRVQRFSATGSDGTILVPPPGRLLLPQGLAVTDSNVLVADDDHHRVAVFSLGGALVRAVGSGQGAGAKQLQFPYDVGADAAGTVYVADDANHRIVHFGAAPTFPYLGRWGAYGTGWGRVQYPRGIAVDGEGNQYVADTGGNRIFVFDRDGTPLRFFGLSGRAPGQYTQPLGVASDASGLRAVADSVDGRVVVLNPDGSVAAVWGSPNPGPTVLSDPVAVAFDAAGVAYVLDGRRNQIVVVARNGAILRKIGHAGSGAGGLESPNGLAIDAQGTLYVADTGNGRIARFADDGTALPSLGALSNVRGVAVAPDGSRVYAADLATNRITVLGPDGATLGQFGGSGRAAGKFNGIAQLSLDPAGNLWVAERSNNRVQELDPMGRPLAMFGEIGAGAGQFVHPTAATVDCHGTLTVTDSDNNRVQQFTLAAPPAATCAALPPVSSPPALKVPIGPPPAAPVVSVSPARRGGVVSRAALTLTVTSDRPSRTRATATLTPLARPKARKGHRRPKAVVVSMRAGSATLAPGRGQAVRLTLSKPAAKRLTRALGARRGIVAQVRVTVVARDGGPATTVTRRLLVTR